MKPTNNQKKIKYITKCQRYEEFIRELLKELEKNNYSKARIQYWYLKLIDISLPL